MLYVESFSPAQNLQELSPFIYFDATSVEAAEALIVTHKQKKVYNLFIN